MTARALRAALEAAAHFLRDARAGASAVEFALVAPVYALTLVGVIEIGLAAANRADMREALRAGAHAAMSGVATAEQIRQVTEDALESQSGFRVTVNETYRCGESVVDASRTSCAGGSAPEKSFIITMTSAARAGLLRDAESAESVEVRVR